MTYTVFIDRRADKEIAALDPVVYRRVKKAVQVLAEQPRPPGIKKLKGVYEDGWRVRALPFRHCHPAILPSWHCFTVALLHRGTASPWHCFTVFHRVPAFG